MTDRNATKQQQRHAIEKALQQRFEFVWNSSWSNRRESTDDPALYTAERKWLQRNEFTRTLPLGVASGLFAFLVLSSRANKPLSLYFRRSKQATTSTIAHGGSRNSPFQRQQQQQSQPNDLSSSPEFFGKLLAAARAEYELFLNVAISSFTCSMIMLINIDPDAIVKNHAEVPLVEGKSYVAQQMCPPMLEEIQRMQTEIQQQQQQQQATTMNPAARTETEIWKDCLDNPQLPVLQAMVRFCQNCQYRANYEKQLLQQAKQQEQSLEQQLRLPEYASTNDGEAQGASDGSMEEGTEQSVLVAAVPSKESTSFSLYIPPPGVPVPEQQRQAQYNSSSIVSWLWYALQQ